MYKYVRITNLTTYNKNYSVLTLQNFHHIFSVNDEGRKKTLKITRQCCHGSARKMNADPYSPCEKVELHSIQETAAQLGGKEFMAIAKKNDLTELLLSNITVFMPNDESLIEFSEQMLESVSLQKKKKKINPCYVLNMTFYFL